MYICIYLSVHRVNMSCTYPLRIDPEKEGIVGGVAEGSITIARIIVYFLRLIPKCELECVTLEGVTGELCCNVSSGCGDRCTLRGIDIVDGLEGSEIIIRVTKAGVSRRNYHGYCMVVTA